MGTQLLSSLPYKRIRMTSVNYRYVVLTLTIVAGLFAGLQVAPAEPVFTSPKEAAADPDFAIQGEYAGPNAGVQVIALGKGGFTATIYKGGLPGAGWNERDRNEDENDAAGIQQLITSLKLKKIERSSPTLGLKAPAGSVVLFDGSPESVQKHWKPSAKVSADGLLMPGCASAENFKDFSLHIEFQLPFMPEARGQGRGNSGIYCQGRFETQMLDSFGLQGKDNECGGLYTIKAPDINMCLPPLSWQTYDLNFTAARWDDKGAPVAARITVRHNGVVIQRDVELPATTAAGTPGAIEAGPILLQDHGNPVRYRNIWLVPRNAEQEARRPYLPGFERFHANSSGVPADGGRLLLGELNCIACHQADGAQAAVILPKQSPVLDEVGKRVHPEFLTSFLANPHAVKPGTSMPDLLSGLPAAERDKAVLALVNFLVRADAPAELSSDPAAIKRGKQLFHQIGCVACHAPEADPKTMPRGSVPLSDLKAKYTVPSLAGFLQEPHRVRPSARMPSFNLEKTEAIDLASYLIGEVNSRPRNANMKFAAYEGNWEKVPKFEDLKPYKTGESAGLDLNMAGREGNFGMRFTGFLKIEREGDYTFHIGSDDGSLLFIDGKKIADADGVHPHSVNSGRAHLKAGLHPIQVDYTQGGGEWTVTLEFEGPGVPRQDAALAIVMTEQGNPTPPPAPKDAKPRFVFEPDLVEPGRVLFTNLGCASCHQLKRDGKTIAGIQAKPLSKLDPTKGCLAISRDTTLAAAVVDPLQPGSGPRLPQFDLNFNQQSALAAAITTPIAADAKPTAAQAITHTMTAFNCYACHSRDKVGGPERDRNALFISAIPEMGDEGRVPPPLDGVGDKLNDEWMRHVLDNGAKDRPYMLTRMPRFGGGNVGHLSAAFAANDRRTEATVPKIEEPEIRTRAAGRFLVGDKALACIKCHRFGENRATGIQALDLQTMTRRIREDWFFRYMVNPEIYRPGTRMPSAFVDGKVAVKDLYHGDANQQLLAIWTFLKAGTQAAVPEGLIANLIELKPSGKPILYRNFLEGLTPRGIAVGYPEKGHLAWDANNLSLTLLWHGRFIDAGKHWEGRGPGKQGPLGDHVVRFEETSPFARLESTGPNVPWPNQPPNERGYRFLGYALDTQGRPHFKYQGPDFAVEDFPQPVPQGAEGSFKRQLTVTATKPVDDLYFRAAAGQTVEAQADGWYIINGVVRVRISGAQGQPALRKSGNLTELLLPVKFTNGKAEITQEIVW
jgi:mono/diheme cytochrome c family protein